MNRDEIIQLIVGKAHEYSLPPWELLGGAIAESWLNPEAERFGVWPDVSFGLFQQTVKFADEGDHTDSAENVALIRQLYFDPIHACDVAAVKYRYWRRDPDVPALTAWVAYNSPGFYKTPDQSPNVENYRRSLEEARRMLGGAPMAAHVTYNRDAPAIAQNDPWSCAPTALRWALTAVGRKPSEAWIEATMIAEGVVSEEAGLLDATGAGLAAFIRRQYGEFGYDANHEPSVTFDALAAEAGPYPILIGGRAWGHWSGLRAYDAAHDLLLLANPGDGWRGVGQTMDRPQFGVLGPWSMVRVLHPDLLEWPPVPTPSPPSPAKPDPRIRVRELLREAISLLEDLS